MLFGLNREYTTASYLSAVSDVKLRKTLTMYRLSEHSLAVETGRRRQTLVSREDRLCSHCMLGVTETELHFLTECPKYQISETTTTPKLIIYFPQFNICSPTQKLSFILGEEAKCALICNIHIIMSSPEDSQRETHTPTHKHTHSPNTHIRTAQHTHTPHTHTAKHTH